MTPEAPIIYSPRTSLGLGAGWEVLQVAQRNKWTVTLARDATGKIMLKIDSVPERWKEINDEETLRLYRKYFGNRDRLREQKAAAEDEPPLD